MQGPQGLYQLNAAPILEQGQGATFATLDLARPPPPTGALGVQGETERGPTVDAIRAQQLLQQIAADPFGALALLGMLRVQQQPQQQAQ